MPWVNEEMCVGCGICVQECPVDAIAMKPDKKALINNEDCIRCGKCHDVCPTQAVRHDGEKIPQLVVENVQNALGLLKHYTTTGDQKAYMTRTIRHFAMRSKVAEQTRQKLQVELEGLDESSPDTAPLSGSKQQSE